MTSVGSVDMESSSGDAQVRESAAPSARGQSVVVGMTMIGVLGNGLERIIEGAIVFALLGELAVVFANVVARSLFGFSFDWVLEISQVALVFLTFVGGALSYRQGAHMRVQAGVQALPAQARPYAAAAADAIVFVVALYLSRQSADLLAQGGQMQMQMLGLAGGWIRAPVTVGVGLIALFAFGRLFSYPIRVLVPAVVTVAVAIGLVFSLTADTVAPNQALAITLAVFAVLMALSVPIGFVFTAISLLYLQQTKLAEPTMVPLTMQHGISGFVLLAVPLFVLAGLVMTEGGLAVPMSESVASVVGRLRGGLLQVIVVTMYLFSGISGSKVADMVAVGSSLSAMLKREGYPKGETAAVLTASAAMGETVPPSIAMLVLGSVSTLSIGTLFMAGLLPAALIALCLMAAIYFRAGKLGLLGAPRVPWREIVRKAVVAVPAFAMPVMLLAGVLTGIATPTEVSSLAVVYGIIMAVLLYHAMDGKAFWRVVSESASMTGNILFVVAAASAFSRTLTAAQVPQRLAALLNVFQGEAWLFMLVSAFFLVFMGAFLEGMPAILVLGTILLPIVVQFGITELQFGIVLIIGMGIGFFSPPIGIGSYFACTIANTNMEESIRPMLYYTAILIIGLLLVALLPDVSLALPRLAGMRVN